MSSHSRPSFFELLAEGTPIFMLWQGFSCLYFVFPHRGFLKSFDHNYNSPQTPPRHRNLDADFAASAKVHNNSGSTTLPRPLSTYIGVRGRTTHLFTACRRLPLLALDRWLILRKLLRSLAYASFEAAVIADDRGCFPAQFCS